MKNQLTAIVLCLTAALITGCASIVSDSKWPVTIHSSPTGANCTIVNTKNGMEIQTGKTPMTITLPAKAGFFRPATYQFRFDQAGYNSTITTLSAGLNGWYIGNLVFGGLVGMLIVDPATGAMWRLDEAVYSSLPPIAGQPVASQD